MQEKQVKTWDDTMLIAIWILLEIIAYCIFRPCPALCFIILILGFPVWGYMASLVCEHVPFLHRSTFTLYYAEDLPPHRIYHILRADENGYILYTENEAMLVSCWCLEHPVSNLKTKEIWNGI